jgi:hypothetical protein
MSGSPTLEAIGLEDIEVERVARIFPGGTIPRDREERCRIVERVIERDEGAFKALAAAGDEEYTTIAPRLYSRLMDYVEGHRDDFGRPDDGEVGARRRDTESKEAAPPDTPGRRGGCSDTAERRTR